jgi:hypothetical protein
MVGKNDSHSYAPNWYFLFTLYFTLSIYGKVDQGDTDPIVLCLKFTKVSRVYSLGVIRINYESIKERDM